MVIISKSKISGKDIEPTPRSYNDACSRSHSLFKAINSFDSSASLILRFLILWLALALTNIFSLWTIWRAFYDFKIFWILFCIAFLTCNNWFFFINFGSRILGIGSQLSFDFENPFYSTKENFSPCLNFVLKMLTTRTISFLGAVCSFPLSEFSTAHWSSFISFVRSHKVPAFLTEADYEICLDTRDSLLSLLLEDSHKAHISSI